jgi:ABC-2 type transport system ATP-binding protein
MDFDLADSFDDQIRTYSKGMRQRASFIKALMNEPELLILDEPFAGLDPEMQEIMRGHLLRLKSEGVTIFFSSHNLYEVNRLCDKIAIIKDGEIKLEESMDNIRKMGGSPETSLEEVYKDKVK